MPNLTLKLNTSDVFDVREFHAHEHICGLYSIEILAHCESPNVDFASVLGTAATFTIWSEHYHRVWDGVCHYIRLLQAEETGVSMYVIGIAPKLWLLTQRRNYRMFQQITEPDIVKKLLDDWSVEAEFRLTDEYKTRKYRVQYAETDYAFLRRVTEDSGISFFFEQSGAQMKLVFSDAPHLGELRPKLLEYHENVTLNSGEYITHLSLGHNVGPGKYTIRDHDYRRPPNYNLSATAEYYFAEAEAQLEGYHYVPGAFLYGSDKGEDTPCADDKGKSRTDEKEAQRLARIRLEARRAQSTSCTFETNAWDLVPGRVIQMRGHPRAQLNEEKWLVLEATHIGSSSGSWTHQIAVASAKNAYRPPLETLKPKVNGVESATVVGPPGEEIHCDEFGRVRVHFHWDRESKMDDDSSCWLHVSHPWAGAAYGAVNLPRVGQEVLVDFLGGDPDRPVIVGRVYTNLQKVPYKLPDHKTQSGWKSHSTGGGGGYNEIMFEDAKGRELVRMQAEKDLRKLVKNCESVTIGNNRSKQVGNNDNLSVGNNRTRLVGNNETVTIGANQTLTVGADQTITLPDGNQTESITGNRTFTLKGDLSETITGNSTHVQVGDQTDTLVGSVTALQTGHQVETLFGNRIFTETGHQVETLIGNRTLVHTGNLDETHTGDSKHTQSGGEVVMHTGARTATQLGNASDTLVGAKMLSVIGPSTTIHAGTATLVQAGNNSEAIGGKKTISAATLDLSAGSIDVEAHGIIVIKGGIIKLNC